MYSCASNFKGLRLAPAFLLYFLHNYLFKCIRLAYLPSPPTRKSTEAIAFCYIVSYNAQHILDQYLVISDC
jgi:hypothetical protein